MDPPEFMLSPLSMIDTDYAMWSPGVADVNWLKEELDYKEFNRTCLMPPPPPPLTVKVCSFFFSPSFSIRTLFFCILVHGDIYLKYLYRDGLAPSIPINPPHLPWTV